MQPSPLHSQKVTVWCGLRAFIVGPLFSEEIGPSGPVTCTVNGTRYESLLRNQLIPALQQRGCVDSTIFMQDDVPPHIVTPLITQEAGENGGQHIEHFLSKSKLTSFS
ncbi:hypothetical protein AVEN_182781-1 [Araneus ventricosus]|uniref:Uncharacterized protein n=1 Tax=Araneus ventricosus TaxID=182803 RepID=A0A4Y2LJR8_ARAVE|nr:hypothetical protein AVEN_182781-1 [Araneus ventricosus]